MGEEEQGYQEEQGGGEPEGGGGEGEGEGGGDGGTVSYKGRCDDYCPTCHHQCNLGHQHGGEHTCDSGHTWADGGEQPPPKPEPVKSICMANCPHVLHEGNPGAPPAVPPTLPVFCHSHCTKSTLDGTHENPHVCEFQHMW